MKEITTKFVGFFILIAGGLLMYSGVYVMIYHPSEPLAYLSLFMGVSLVMLAYYCCSGNYKVEPEYKDYGLTCKKCGRTASIGHPTEAHASMAKTAYDNKCPYCRAKYK